MAAGTAPEAEPTRKKQKVDHPQALPIPFKLSESSPSPGSSPVPDPEWDSSFAFGEHSLPQGPVLTADDYILDITKYIPIGCLRVQRSVCGISSEIWRSCQSWRALSHPRDVFDSQPGPLLLNAIQDKLSKSPALYPYRALHNAGWIRMEFKASSDNWGQVRVYILPDDVGRRAIDRNISSLRKSMVFLLGQLDISKATWNGQWDNETPVAHIDIALDQIAEDQSSLFHIFNTLPSPNPDPEIVADLYARDAMYQLLESDVGGLNTKLHSYQRRSAALMLQREVQPAQLLDPRLRTMVDQRGSTWYCDVDSGLCLREPRTYEAARGGICAETMGLGKTLICLALILATREISSKIPAEYSVGTIPVRKTTGSLLEMAAAAIGRTGTPWKGEFARLEAEGYEFSRCKAAIQRNPGCYYVSSPERRRESRHPATSQPRKIYLTTATLVVVPANLVQQWLHEIEKHTFGLKVLVMKSMRDSLPPVEELVDYDIILFSKQRFEKESKDGTGSRGRKEDCYFSPLKQLHFKRLITDEGHSFGNSSGSSKTEAVAVVESLQLSARWIVSGTPTQGLYGAEVAVGDSNTSSDFESPEFDVSGPSHPAVRVGPKRADMMDIDMSSSSSGSSISEQEELFNKQERKDLEKLGNIASVYLKARPWANTHEDNDRASWSQLVMQPRHGPGSHGNMECLRATLEGMIIRHRPEDIAQDVTLPPIKHDFVSLEGSMQNKLSLNTFSMMIITNAVTSERKDADYFFHPRQRKNLLQLVSNLRQSSFFWSGFEVDHVCSTVENARQFLEKRTVPVTPEDEALMKQAIEIGEAVLTNNISRAISQWHEMPMYIDIDCPEDVRKAWSLDGASTNPILMGATMVNNAQKFVELQSWREDQSLMEGLATYGLSSMDAAARSLAPDRSAHASRRKSSRADPNITKKGTHSSPALAGGVTVGDETSPRKRTRSSTMQTALDVEMALSPSAQSPDSPRKSLLFPQKSALKPSKPDISGILDPESPFASTTIVSTASAKLSYLMDRILVHQAAEKILVFYEADNVAYYIAQALECLGVKHLIYAKSLSPARRSQYVVTFNQSEVFRVLLMDVSQAAFGLDLSSASRVYFVNPVFSPQVEAQAVKRAHRIGQVKPVYVETLVLKGSIEEAILERRKDMSSEEHNKCKTILDDQKLYDWIRNVRFLPIPIHATPDPEQMAKLETPQPMFCQNAGEPHDPDADLIMDEGKNKRIHKEFLRAYDFASGSLDPPGISLPDLRSAGVEIVDAFPSEDLDQFLMKNYPREYLNALHLSGDNEGLHEICDLFLGSRSEVGPTTYESQGENLLWKAEEARRRNSPARARARGTPSLLFNESGQASSGTSSNPIEIDPFDDPAPSLQVRRERSHFNLAGSESLKYNPFVDTQFVADRLEHLHHEYIRGGPNLSKVEQRIRRAEQRSSINPLAANFQTLRFNSAAISSNGAFPRFHQADQSSTAGADTPTSSTGNENYVIVEPAPPNSIFGPRRERSTPLQANTPPTLPVAAPLSTIVAAPRSTIPPSTKVVDLTDEVTNRSR